MVHVAFWDKLEVAWITVSGKFSMRAGGKVPNRYYIVLVERRKMIIYNKILRSSNIVLKTIV